MTTKQFALTYTCLLIGAYLLTWPVAILALMFFFHINGDLKK
jgi:hypothetical protein